MEEGKLAGRDPTLEQLVSLRQTCAEMQVSGCQGNLVANDLKSSWRPGVASARLLLYTTLPCHEYVPCFFCLMSGT